MATKSFTILYKNTRKFDTDRTADPVVYRFETAAKDEKDAVRIFKLSRMYHVRMSDGKTSRAFKGFKVVRVYHGDGIHRCTCDYCKTHPEFAPAIRVIKSRKPSWMNKSFSR